MSQADPKQLLAVVDRISTKIVLTNQDSVLQELIQTYLPKLLSLLLFQDENVRNKVVQTLSHINKRVKGQNNIMLPFVPILDLFLSQGAISSPFLKNFATIYLDLAFERLPNKEKSDAVGSICDRLKQLSQNMTMEQQFQQDALLRYLLQAVQVMEMPSLQGKGSIVENKQKQLEMKQMVFVLSEEDIEKETVSISSSTTIQAMTKEDGSRYEEKPQNVLAVVLPDHVKTILSFFRDVMMLRASYSLGGNGEQVSIPEGLSIGSLRRIVGTTQKTAAQVVDMKTAVIKFLTSGIFEDNTILPHLVIGTSDSNEQLRETCEATIKKLGKINLEDSKLMSDFCEIYLGNPDFNRSQAVESVKLRILNFMSKSITAANFFPQVKTILFDSLFAEYASTKLKTAGMHFFIWVVTHAKAEAMQPYSPDIFTKLQDSMSRLSSTKGYSHHEKLEINVAKENLYIALGALAKKFPQFVKEKFHIVQMYFSALETEDPQVRIYIQQGLANLIYAYKDADAEMQSNLTKLFLKVVDSSSSSDNAVLAALQSANRLFPFHHIPSRFISLLRSDDPKTHVREEAQRGSDIEKFSKFQLFSDTKKVSEAIKPEAAHKYPKFEEMIAYIYNYLSTPNKRISIGAHVVTLDFCRKCLLASVPTESSLLTYVTALTKAQLPNSQILVLDAYLKIVELAFNDGATGVLLHEAASSVLQILVLNPDFFGPAFLERFYHLALKYLYAGDDLSRERMARLIAVLYMYADQKTQAILISSLREKLDTSNLTATESRTFASVLTLGNIVALQYKKVGPVISKELEGVIEEILGLIDLNLKPSIQYAAFLALGEIGRHGAFNYLNTQQPATESAEKKRKVVSKKEVLQIIINKLKSKTTSPKLQEKIATCLGMISLGEPEEQTLKDILDALFILQDVKAEEIEFTVGEALSYLAAGEKYCSLLKEDLYARLYTQGEKPHEEQVRNKMMGLTLQKVVREGVLSPKKIVRQTCSIWLLAIVKYCGASPALRKYLAEIQQAFSILLADSNEVTQEVAGKGMSYVYELGDERTKKSLVNSLLDTFSGKKQTNSIKTSEESDLVIFPEDVKKGTNSTIPSTYKELCTVATEIGKPDMVYKLMQLSNTNTVWNAKKAAAFSAASIANLGNDAEELKKILPMIVPKLFRYLFDPNPLISRSMGQMWRALVSDPEKTVNDFLPAIMKEIIEGVNSEMWRIREASCNAMSEVYSGRKFSEMEPYITESFLRIFRVMDDQKESSRKAAQSCLMKLGQFSIKICNPVYTHPEQVSRALSIVVPIYLEKGIHFPVKEVVFFSLEKLKEICDVSMSLIRPHITEIVGNLIEQMSVLEPQGFNYLQLHQERLNFDQEELEKYRMMVSNASPINDIIGLCERYVSKEVFVTLVPRLIDLASRGIGFPTRMATARLIENIAKFHGKNLKDYSPKLLRSIMSAIEHSKSPSERAAWASALPYVIKVAKVSASKKIIDEVLSLYLNSNEANSTSSTTTAEEWNEKRYISAVVMAYISKYVIAIVRKFFDEILPVIFIARHDPVEKVRKAWIDVWDEVLTTTPRDAMQLYSKQIAKVCFTSLNHSSWTLKKQGGKGLLELSKEAGKDISVELKKEIIQQLHDNIRGRIWDGKEFLLEALAETCSAFSSSDIEKGPEEAKLIAKSIDLLLKECQRSIKVNVHKFRAYVAFARILQAEPIQENLITLQLYNEAKQVFIKELETCSNIDNLIEEEAKTSKEMSFEQKQALAKIKEKEVDVLKAEIYTCISRLIPSKKLVNAAEYTQSVQSLVQFLSDRLQSASTIGETQAQLNSLSFSLKTYAISDTIPLISSMAKGLLRALDSGYNPLPVRNLAVEVVSEFITYLKTNQAQAEEQVKATFLLLKEQLKMLEQKEKDYLLQEKVQSIYQREIPQL